MIKGKSDVRIKNEIRNKNMYQRKSPTPKEDSQKKKQTQNGSVVAEIKSRQMRMRHRNFDNLSIFFSSSSYFVWVPTEHERTVTNEYALIT